MSNYQKKSHKKEILISLIVSLCLLGIVIGVSFLYQSWRHVQFDLLWMFIGDAVGFLIIWAIVYHFIKKPDDDQT
ncbi:MAG: hypothetical protein IJH32_06980 [Ruminococcus sp.]|nr:hypothetical protein [Ruminococcus sp.]